MISTNLETLRVNKGLSRKKLAELSGVHYSTIGLIEWGMSPHPRITTLQKLAVALGVTVNDLIDD